MFSLQHLLFLAPYFLSANAVAISPSSNATITTGSALPTGCALDNCLFASYIPSSYKPDASAFCSAIINHKPTAVTQTAVSFTTLTLTVTPAAAQVTLTSAATVTVTNGVACNGGTTVYIPFSTSLDYASQPAATTLMPAKREPRTALVTLSSAAYHSFTTTSVAAAASVSAGAMPDWFMSGCKKCRADSFGAKLSSACSCFLTTPTVTATAVQTVTTTVTAAVAPATAVVTALTSVTVTACTTTIAVTSAASPSVCGTTFTAYPSASSSGTITCANSVPAPSANVRFRIEGNDSEGTIFEDCVVAGPRNVTTPSGGTHECDGTNAGANPAPGTTPTDQLDAAARLNGFAYDGTYDASFSDYFITSIAASSSTASQFWGILVNGQYTPTGGCQFEVANGDRSLWAYDAFNKNAFLRVQPDYAVAEAGRGVVSVTVTDDQTGDPVAGAAFGGQTTDANGCVTVQVPALPGCYQMKATAAAALRSNAFYLTVVESFA